MNYFNIGDLPKSPDVSEVERHTEILLKGRPLLVTRESHSDYAVVGMYMVEKTMTREEYISLVTKTLGGVQRSDGDEYMNVSTLDFLKYAVDNGYITGPIYWTEANDAFGLDVR